MKTVKKKHRRGEKNQVWIMRADGRKKKFVGGTGTDSILDVSFSPDSRYIIVEIGFDDLVIDPLFHRSNEFNVTIRSSGPQRISETDWQSR